MEKASRWVKQERVDNVEYKQVGDREGGKDSEWQREKVDNIGKRVGDSASHHLLPLSFKYTPQYLFCDKGQNSFKHIQPAQC